MKALIGAAALLCAGSAHAAVYTYDYDGQEFTCAEWPDLCGTPPPSALTGGLTVDTSGLAQYDFDLAGSTILYDGLNGEWSISNGSSYYREILDVPDNGLIPYSLPDFLTLSGQLWDYFSSGGTQGYFSFQWEFDENRDVVAWAGYDNSRIDDYGYATGTEGDRWGDYWFSSGPGAWTQEGGTLPPAPVPLPAAGFLLVAGLGGLVAMRMRRR